MNTYMYSIILVGTVYWHCTLNISVLVEGKGDTSGGKPLVDVLMAWAVFPHLSGGKIRREGKTMREGVTRC